MSMKIRNQGTPDCWRIYCKSRAELLIRRLLTTMSLKSDNSGQHIYQNDTYRYLLFESSLRNAKKSEKIYITMFSFVSFVNISWDKTKQRCYAQGCFPCWLSYSVYLHTEILLIRNMKFWHFVGRLFLPVKLRQSEYVNMSFIII